MRIPEFLEKLKASNLFLAVNNDQLILKQKRSNSGSQDAAQNEEVFQYIRSNKKAIIQYLQGGESPTSDIEATYKLSPLQLGMLFHNIYEAESGAYCNQFKCDLVDLNESAFVGSWNSLVKNHTILRSSFSYDELNMPTQRVHRHIEVPIEFVDLRNVDEPDCATSIRSLEMQEYKKRFDFSCAPLMRVMIIRISDRISRMLWTYHHIIHDGWSLPILMEEFLKTYEMLIQSIDLPVVVEDRYEEYIRYIESRDLEGEKLYWENYLHNVESATLLPFVLQSTKRTKSVEKFNEEVLVLDESVAKAIDVFAKKTRITTNTLMQGVWLWMLHKYTGESDVSFGVVVSGRPEDLPNVERKVGMYINTLPLRSVSTGDERIGEWLRNIQLSHVKSRKYQYSSLADIQRWSSLNTDLFDTIMVFQNYPVSKLVNSKDWSLKVENVSSIEQTSNYPLLIRFSLDLEITIQFIYKGEILETSYVQQIKKHFQNVLSQFLNSGDQLLREVNLYPSGDESKLLYQFYQTQAFQESAKTLVDIFIEQAAASPQQTAVVFGAEKISYHDLDLKSNQVANFLRKHRVKKDDLVPISVSRSIEMIVGILGILKAGAAYVPIDPKYPQQRVSFILEDIRANILVTDDTFCSHVESTINVLNISKIWNVIALESTNLTNPEVSESGLAYVMYTSGTTGTPKGVMLEHKSVAGYISMIWKLFDVKQDEGILQLANFCFDASVEQIFLAFKSGARLLLVPDHVKLDKHLLEELVSNNQVTHLHATPSYLRAISDVVFPSVKRVVSAGELCFPDLAERWINKCDFYNKYGPTEAAISVAMYKADPKATLQPDRSLPVGVPIPNNQIFILSQDLKPQPVGVTGEIFIGGPQLARGYLNNSRLTEENFIVNPFDPTAKLYRTGDLARWVLDGNIEFVGRADNQVKIRGYRVELGEIEHILIKAPGIRECAVISSEDHNKIKRLIAYITTDATFDEQAVLGFLKSHLPEFMIPNSVVRIDKMPINSNGKIEKKSLSKNVTLTDGSPPYTAPRNQTEDMIALIWQEVLGIEKVGITDNFFELGGDSIVTIQVVSRARKLGYDLLVDDLFTYQTISAIYEAMQKRLQLQGVGTSSINTLTTDQGVFIGPDAEISIDGIESHELNSFLDEILDNGEARRKSIDSCHKLSPLQAGMLFHSLYDEQAATYRNQLKCDLLSVREDEFAKTWKEFIKRHTILRSSFHPTTFNIPVQCVHREVVMPLDIIDLQHLAHEEQLLKVISIEDADLKQGFDFKCAPLMRVTLLRLTESNYRMLWTSHHLLHDGWSLPLMMEEFLSIYDSLATGKPLEKVPEDRYADYIEFLDQRDKSAEESYWRRHLDGIEQGSLLPFMENSNNRNKGIGNYSEETLSIDADVTQQIRSFAKRHHITVNTLMQGVWSFMLHKYTNSSDIVFGVVTSGRPESLSNVEKRIGMYINTLPLRSLLSDETDVTEWLSEMQQTQLNSRKHQYASLVDIQRWIGIQGDLFDSILAFQNFPVRKIVSENKWQLKVDNLLVQEQSNYPLYITIGAFETINVHFFYNTILLKPFFARQMKLDFQTVLSQFISGDKLRLRDIKILDRKVYHKIVDEFNQTAVPRVQKQTIIDFFDFQVAKTPQNIAVVFGSEILSYRDLGIRSNQLGYYLMEQGVRPDDVVPVLLPRSVNMVVAILAILKAGAAYLPIDPLYPSERINFMLSDARAKIVLHAGSFKNKIGTEMKSINIDDKSDVVESQNPGHLNHSHPSSLAYVIYTSGSTGSPKGVMIEHLNLLNYVLYGERYYLNKNFETGGSYAHLTYTFDASITSLFVPLISGKKVVMAPDSTHDIFTDPTFRQNAPYDFIKITPGQIPLLEQGSVSPEFQLTKRIIIGGEQLHYDQIGPLLTQFEGIEIINEYGPTEATVGCCTYSVFAGNQNNVAEGSVVPVGKPIDNVKIYILDVKGEPVPIGVTGEIYISGSQVARGYLNNQKLTEEKFIVNTFTEGKLYKTGDFGKWLPDGNIVFIGRADEQVKIRGYRIELAEIEHTLRKIQGVQDAKVISSTRQSTTAAVLIGFVVLTHSGKLAGKSMDSLANEKERVVALQNALGDLIPNYMMLHEIVIVDQIPLTREGKVDRKMLLSKLTKVTSSENMRPLTELEVQLCEIWKQLLGLDSINVKDDFFELGGDSLLSIQLISRIRKNLNAEISISTFFELNTIENLARFIELNHRPDVEIGGLETVRL